MTEQQREMFREWFFLAGPEEIVTAKRNYPEKFHTCVKEYFSEEKREKNLPHVRQEV